MGGQASFEVLGRSRHVRHSSFGRGFHRIAKARAAGLLLVGLLTATCNNECSGGVSALGSEHHPSSGKEAKRARKTPSRSREDAKKSQQRKQVVPLMGGGGVEGTSQSSPTAQQDDTGQTTTKTAPGAARKLVAPLPRPDFTKKTRSGEAKQTKKAKSPRILSEGEISESDDEEISGPPAGKACDPAVEAHERAEFTRSVRLLSEGEIPDSDRETDQQGQETGGQAQETIQEAEETPATVFDGDQFIVLDIGQFKMQGKYKRQSVYNRKGALTGAPYLYIRAGRQLSVAIDALDEIPQPASGNQRTVVFLVTSLYLESLLKYFEENVEKELPDAFFIRSLDRTELDDSEKVDCRGNLGVGFDPGRYNQYFLQTWIKASFREKGRVVSRFFDRDSFTIRLPKKTKYKDSPNSNLGSPFNGEFKLRHGREKTYIISSKLHESDLVEQTEITETLLEEQGLSVSNHIWLFGKGALRMRRGSFNPALTPSQLQDEMEVVFEKLPVLSPFDPSSSPAKERTIIVDFESENFPEPEPGYVAAHGRKAIFVKHCSVTNLKSCAEMFPTKLKYRQDDVYIKATGSGEMRSLTNMLHTAKGLSLQDSLEIFKYALIKKAPDEASPDYENEVGEKQNVTAEMAFWPNFHELRAGFMKVDETVCDMDVVLTFSRRQSEVTLETGESFLGGSGFGKMVVTFKFDRILAQSFPEDFGTTQKLNLITQQEYMYPRATKIILKGRTGYNLRTLSESQDLSIHCGNAVMDITWRNDNELGFEHIRVKAKYNHSSLQLLDPFSLSL